MGIPNNSRGFTLIEIMIVVLIISVLAAIAIPGYLGLQEKARKGAITRSMGAAESEIQGWLVSARRGTALTEVDSNGDGIINDSDVNNYTLALDLTVQNQLCSRYIMAKWNISSERSPWDPANSLWITGTGVPGRVSCYHDLNGRLVTITAQDTNGTVFYSKNITSD
ncbi:MAG: prepilin-type N-terminal cleavage/methylation domain-containing protein [Nitrospirota bacterium]